MSLHERLRTGEPLARGSDRAFGLAFAFVGAMAGGALPLLLGGTPRWWLLAIAAALLAVALARPGLLALPNRGWYRVRLLLSRIVNPLVMAVLFYGVVTPTGLALRAFGKDPLRRRFDPAAASYWLPRDPPGPDPGTMQRQF